MGLFLHVLLFPGGDEAACRAALERCIANGRARLSYRWKDGQVTETSFHRVTPGRVKVFGLALKGRDTVQAA